MLPFLWSPHQTLCWDSEQGQDLYRVPGFLLTVGSLQGSRQGHNKRVM